MHRADHGLQHVESFPVIDRLIHFVWAGGKMMGADKQAVVLQWADANPGYEVNIWIDSKTTSKEELENFSQKILHDSKHKNIKLRDIAAENLDDEYVRYDIDGTRKNYGGSSDKLRYSILYQNGGIYVDADVLPVGSLPEAIPAPHGALFAPHSQGVATIGNDTLLAVRGSKIFRDLARLARESYDKTPEDWKNRRNITISSIEGYPASYDILYALDSPSVKASLTLDRTGPSLVRNYLKSLGVITPEKVLSKEGDVPANVAAIVILNRDYKMNSDYLIDGKYFKAIEQENGNKNTLGWMKTGIVDASYENKLAMTLASIKFEIAHMGMLRLNEHVAALVYQKDGNGKITEEQALKDLLTALSARFDSGEIPRDKIRAYQIIPYMGYGIGEEFYLKYFQDDQTQKFSIHQEVLENIILGRANAAGLKKLSDDEACALLQKIVHVCGGAEGIVSHSDELNVWYGFCKRILPMIDTYPKTINFIFSKFPDAFLSRMIKFELRYIAANYAENKEAISKAAAFINKIVSRVTSNNQLVNLLSEMELTSQSDYNLLRTESDLLRRKFGNTEAWDKVLSAIKSKIVENIKYYPDRNEMTAMQVQELRALLAISSKRMLSSIFSSDDTLAEFDRLTGSVQTTDLKKMRE